MEWGPGGFQKRIKAELSFNPVLVSMRRRAGGGEKDSFVLQKDTDGLCGGRKMVLGGLGGGFLLKAGTLSTSPEGERNSQMAPTPDRSGGFTPPVVLWGRGASGKEELAPLPPFSPTSLLGESRRLWMFHRKIKAGNLKATFHLSSYLLLPQADKWLFSCFCVSQHLNMIHRKVAR